MGFKFPWVKSLDDEYAEAAQKVASRAADLDDGGGVLLAQYLTTESSEAKRAYAERLVRGAARAAEEFDALAKPEVIEKLREYREGMEKRSLKLISKATLAFLGPMLLIVWLKLPAPTWLASILFLGGFAYIIAAVPAVQNRGLEDALGLPRATLKAWQKPEWMWRPFIKSPHVYGARSGVRVRAATIQQEILMGDEEAHDAFHDSISKSPRHAVRAAEGHARYVNKNEEISYALAREVRRLARDQTWPERALTAARHTYLEQRRAQWFTIGSLGVVAGATYAAFVLMDFTRAVFVLLGTGASCGIFLIALMLRAERHLAHVARRQHSEEAARV